MKEKTRQELLSGKAVYVPNRSDCQDALRSMGIEPVKDMGRHGSWVCLTFAEAAQAGVAELRQDQPGQFVGRWPQHFFTSEA